MKGFCDLCFRITLDQSAKSRTPNCKKLFRFNNLFILHLPTAQFIHYKKESENTFSIRHSWYIIAITTGITFLKLFMCRYWMIVTMLHWFIQELITKHPSDASELINASCLGFRFAQCLLALLQGCQPQQNLAL